MRIDIFGPPLVLVCLKVSSACANFQCLLIVSIQKEHTTEARSRSKEFLTRNISNLCVLCVLCGEMTLAALVALRRVGSQLGKSILSVSAKPPCLPQPG